MKEPVRILSDLHLGHKVSRIEQVAALRPLIAGAGTVIFNGDTWQELAGPFRKRSAEMLVELQSLCADEGVETLFLSGNHDPSWPGCGWVELADGKIIVTHGDALLYDGSPWKREVLHAAATVRELWNQYPDSTQNATERILLAREIAHTLCSLEYPTGRHFLQRAWDALLPPKRATKMLEAWFTQGITGAQFCEQYFPKAEVLVIGHFHWQGTWTRNQRRVINTGSFTNPGRAQWVDWNDGWLRRGIINESPQTCSIGRILDVWRL